MYDELNHVEELINASQYQKALTLLHEIVVVPGPWHEEAVGYLIYVYARLGRCDLARKAYFETDIRTPYIAIQALEFAAAEGDERLGLLLADKALEKPDYYDIVHHGLGLMYSNLANWQKALEHLELAASVDKENMFLQAHIARSYLEVGNSSRTSEVISTALRKSPKHPSLLRTQALILTELGDHPSARAVLDDLRTIDSQNPTTYTHSGMNFYQVREYGKAILEFDKALELAPNYNDALLVRAVCKHKLRDTQGAIRDLQVVLSNTPANIKAARLLCKYQLKSFQPVKALNTLLAVARRTLGT